MNVAASSTTEVNDLRVCQKGRDYRLSPACYHHADNKTYYCLFMHLLRANYQTASWKCCLQARPTLPDPTKCGWIDYDGKLDLHSLDADATSTRCCLGIVGLQVCPFLSADNVCVHGKYITFAASCSHAVTRNRGKMIASN